MFSIEKRLKLTPIQGMFLLAFHGKNSLTGVEVVNILKNNLGETSIPTPGATYKVLQYLVDEELIKETTKEEQRGDKRLRTYSITEKGENILKELIIASTKVYNFMNQCCPENCEECFDYGHEKSPKKC